MNYWEKSDGAFILITFTEEISSFNVTDVNHITVSWKEYDAVPGGVLISKSYNPIGIYYGEDNWIIVLEMPVPYFFRNAVGNITVTYDGDGYLYGYGGPVEAFSVSFTPIDLLARPNQNHREYLSITSASWTGALYRQIDTSTLTKIYNPNVNYGSNGTKVSAALSLMDENIITSNMSGGWNASTASIYDTEDLSGAYAGFTSITPIPVAKVKFWIGRYVYQNSTLYATVEYLDGNGDWNEVEDMAVTTSIPYPNNIFTVTMLTGIDIYGVRWIHRKEPIKTSGNNVSFFGMTLWEARI